MPPYLHLLNAGCRHTYIYSTPVPPYLHLLNACPAIPTSTQHLSHCTYIYSTPDVPPYLHLLNTGCRQTCIYSKKRWERFPIHEIRRINGGRGFQTGGNVFQISGNTFFDQKNKILMKIPEFKRSRIRIIAEFRGIPSKFPNQEPQPQQILKSTLFECSFIQDPWDNYNDLYGCIAMDSWDSTQMNDSDPCLLAIKTSKSKYNKDNLSFESAVCGPFQAEYWKAMEVELDMLKTDFKCWDLVPRTPDMKVISSTWSLQVKRYHNGMHGEEIQSTVLCLRQPTKRGN